MNTNTSVRPSGERPAMARTSDNEPTTIARDGMNDNDSPLTVVAREVRGWPGVSQEPGRFNSIAFLFGRREIGHIHRNGVADLPFPRAMYDELIASGRAEPHHVGVRGYVSVRLDSPVALQGAIDLFRLNYDRAKTAADAPTAS